MNKKIGFVLIIILFVAMTTFGQSSESILVLEDLLSEVLERNPSIKSLQNSSESLKAKIPRMGSMPDPQLKIGIINLPTDTYTLNSDPMTQRMIGISQNFPFFGKLSLKEQLSSKDYLVSANMLSNEKLNLLKEIKQEYFELLFINQSLAIVTKSHSLLDNYVKIASTRYVVGKGIQQDVIKSEVELLKLEKSILSLGQEKAAAQAKLNSLLNYPPQRHLGQPQSYKIPQQEWNVDELQKLALANNPQIAMEQLKIEKRKIALDLSEREYWPDFSFALNYGQRNERPDFLSGVLSLNIPLYAANKQSKKVEEETIALRSAEQRFNERKNDIMLQVKLILDMLDRNRKMLKLYKEGILPQAKQALESAIAAYKTDQVDFITLMNNQITLLNHEIEYYRVLKDYQLNVANIEMVCATKLVDYATED
jgi:outer membrane protein TolC